METGTGVQNGWAALWIVSSGDYQSEDKEAVLHKEHVGKIKPSTWLRGDFLSLEAKEEKPRERRKEKQ